MQPFPKPNSASTSTTPLEIFASSELLQETDTSITRHPSMEPIAGDYNPLLTLLGFERLDQLEALSIEQRRAVLAKKLVANKSLELGPCHTRQTTTQEFNMRLISGRGGHSDFEWQLAEEARRVFYRKNQFVMWSTHLDVFLQGDYGDRASSPPVSELVHDLVIALSCYRGNFEASAMALQNALCFTHLNHLSIELWGHVALDGSDFATQRMLHAVSRTVKQIMQRDDLCVAILRVLVDGNTFGPYPHHEWMGRVQDLKPYWNIPTDEVIERVKEGDGSFEELMQVQMAAWTDPDFVSYWFDDSSLTW